jgi:FkbM family methyltransferase
MDEFKVSVMGGVEFLVPSDSNPGHFQLMNHEIFNLKMYDYHKCPLPDTGVILDIGANVGAFAVYALRKGNVKVISVEPSHCVASLRKNLSPFKDRSIIRNIGVWSYETTLKFDINRYNPGCNKVLRPGDVQQELVDFPVTTIDHLVNDLDIQQVDFIKMDIEGSEREALEGARSTIKRFRPKMALCVYHRQGDEEIIPQIVKEIVGSYNYEMVNYVEVFNSRIAYFW